MKNRKKWSKWARGWRAMGSKLEYCFLLTKIAVMVLDVMIEDHQRCRPSAWRLVVDLVACWRWDCSSTNLLKPVNFPKSNFQSGLGFGFSNSPKVPPNCPKFAQSPIFHLVNYWRWKFENPKNSQLPQIHPIHQKISQCFQSRRQSPISKVLKLSNLKVTKPDWHNFYYIRQ